MNRSPHSPLGNNQSCALHDPMSPLDTLNPGRSANSTSPDKFTRDGGSFNELTQTLIDAGFGRSALNRTELARVLAADRMQRRRWIIWLQTSTPYWSMHKPVQAKRFMSWDMPLETASLAPSRCIIPAAHHVGRDPRGVTRPTPGTARSDREGLRSVS